jgi:orotate phosphoribosyltransferase
MELLENTLAPASLRGAEVVGVVTIVDRQEGAAHAFAAAGLTPILTLADFKG